MIDFAARAFKIRHEGYLTDERFQVLSDIFPVGDVVVFQLNRIVDQSSILDTSCTGVVVVDIVDVVFGLPTDDGSIRKQYVCIGIGQVTLETYKVMIEFVFPYIVFARINKRITTFFIKIGIPWYHFAFRSASASVSTLLLASTCM
ncbi:TPA_asm: hypothetical protein [Abeoforma parvovirus]|nr:TPA_asm: hypothetical protein [Abeoforma parvovirus]